ncbi:hypothetical protein FB566_4721 [Stackebrandtia endophytica]|uniref:Uncharacterized protein n=1 Tax=Stackebrandtia endophytica TaxID=1496996 RepID=A0A543B2X0_9ACTN|nr:hypothetical protein [Stackebrandtia endophytica]TQL79120.1 hypothetical protein FB566_4721 [Stackebrandtia endophytica]
MTEIQNASNTDAEAVEGDEEQAPMNRAERRAAKRNKGKNQVKGVAHGVDKSFTPKDVKVAGHKEFTNRKSG